MSEALQEHKCLIAGVGRSGTTFLVQLLTELGLDTGFADPAVLQANYVDAAKAGLEISLLKSTPSPYIVKDPRISNYFEALMASGRFVIDHVFIPLRKLDDAAMSRIRNSESGNSAGGLWMTRHAHLQKPVLAETFYAFVHQLVYHEIPHTFLEFPRLVKDGDYLYRQLHFFTRQIARDSFDAAFQRVARPELVHEFSEQDKRRWLTAPSLPNRVVLSLRDQFLRKTG